MQGELDPALGRGVATEILEGICIPQRKKKVYLRALSLQLSWRRDPPSQHGEQHRAGICLVPVCRIWCVGGGVLIPP